MSGFASPASVARFFSAWTPWIGFAGLAAWTLVLAIEIRTARAVASDWQSLGAQVTSIEATTESARWWTHYGRAERTWETFHVTYEYTWQGRAFSGSRWWLGGAPAPEEAARGLRTGDTIVVRVDPERPSEACVAFEPAGALTRRAVAAAIGACLCAWVLVRRATGRDRASTARSR